MRGPGVVYGHKRRRWRGGEREEERRRRWHCAERAERTRRRQGGQRIRRVGGAKGKEPAQAGVWYGETAKSGDVGAQYLMASMYETGWGVERDLRLARYWYDIAARNGDEAAPYKLKAVDDAIAAAAGSV